MPRCTPDPISAAQPVHAVATAEDNIRCNDFVWSNGSKKDGTAIVVGNWNSDGITNAQFVGVAVSSALANQRTTIAVAGVITAHADIPQDARKIGTRLKVSGTASTNKYDRESKWRAPRFAKADANDTSYVTFLHTDSRDTDGPGSFRVLLTGGSTGDSVKLATTKVKAAKPSAPVTPPVVVQIDASTLEGWITTLQASLDAKGDGTKKASADDAAQKIQAATVEKRLTNISAAQTTVYTEFNDWILTGAPSAGNFGAPAPPYPPSAVLGGLGHIVAAKEKGAGTALLRAEALKSARKFDRAGKTAASAHIKRFKETGTLGAELAGLFVGYSAAEAEAASNFIATGI